MSATRWLLTLLSFAAVVAVSAYVVITSWPQEGGGAIGIPLWIHAAAALLVMLEVLSRGFKIKMCASSVGVDLGVGASVRTTLAGDFGGAVTPSRSGCEPARYLVLAEAGLKIPQALAVLVIELTLEFVGLGLVAVVVTIVAQGSRALLAGVFGIVGLYLAAMTGLAMLGAVVARRPAGEAPPKWARRIGLGGRRRWRFVRAVLVQLERGMTTLRGARIGPLFVALAATLIHVMLRLLVLPLIVLPVAPEVPYAKLLLWPLALFYGSVVTPVPGGGGLIEVGFKAALGSTIPARVFPAALIWWRFYTYYAYMLLGAVATWRTVMRALRGEAEDALEEEAKLEEPLEEDEPVQPAR